MLTQRRAFMSKRNLVHVSLFTAVLVLAFVFPTKSQMTGPQFTVGINDLIANANVNMVSNGVGNYKERQNEPSIAVSSIDPDHLLAGANDYTTIALNASDPTLGITGDAWLGVFKSYDGGESWSHEFMPGASFDGTPLEDFQAAADPTVRAGIDGIFYYSGIAFDREENGNSVIFVSKWIDDGTFINRDNKSGENRSGITIIDRGTSGQFSDKPWLAVDVPRPQSSRDGVAYIIYAVFLGQIDQNIHSKIMVSSTTNGGKSWSRPIKISEGQQKNQGTTVAIDPTDGTVYVAWRRFAAVNAPDALMIAKSVDFGKTFTKAEELAVIPRPFDQSSYGVVNGLAQPRIQAYPSMAVDEYGTVYLAWSQRGNAGSATDPFKDDARIVLASFGKGSWNLPLLQSNIREVESPFMYVDGSGKRIGYPEYDRSGTIINKQLIHGHQFMPALSYAAGKLLIAWYDSRFSGRYFDEFGQPRSDAGEYGEPASWGGDDRIMDIPPGSSALGPTFQDFLPFESEFRETVDVRTIQIDPLSNSDFEPSIQTSRYAWVQDPNDPYIGPNKDLINLRQGQFNALNYPLFSSGSTPFNGDYLDITPSVWFVNDGTGFYSWRFNQTGDPFQFHVSWTDNRDVVPPLIGNWNQDFLSVTNDCDFGMRDQNIYVSKITLALEMGMLGDFVKLKEDLNVDHVFVIYINNQTGSPFEFYSEKTFKLAVQDPAASFFPDYAVPSGNLPDGTDAQTIIVDVLSNSALSRMVFAPQGSDFPLDIQVSERIYSLDENGEEIFTDTLLGSILVEPQSESPLTGWTTIREGVTFNWDITTTDYGSPVSKDILNPNILSPNILSPNILSPNILSPNILSPNILSPNILSPNILSPNILSPNILSPNILSPNILSPNILSPNILSTSPGDLDVDIVVDKFWGVKNDTGTVQSYTFKSIAGDSLPSTADVLYAQLLVYGIHYLSVEATVPFVIDYENPFCELKIPAQYDLLVNETPNIIENVDINNMGEYLGDPETAHQFENATFSLDPGEEAVIILRFIHVTSPPNKPLPGQTSMSGMTMDMYMARISEVSTQLEESADTFGGVVISHDSSIGTYDMNNPGVGLMILPVEDRTGSGKILAGVPFTQIIRAIGGSIDYSSDKYTWDPNQIKVKNEVTGEDLSLFALGLNSDAFYEEIEEGHDFHQMLKISGSPILSGLFRITVEVHDNPDAAEDASLDTETFLLEILEPEDLTITFSPDPLPDSVEKGSNFAEIVSFSASGGIPGYNWDVEILDSNNAPVSPGVFGWTFDYSSPDFTMMTLVGAPVLAGDFTVTVTLSDSYFTDPADFPSIHWNLCIAPFPLDMTVTPEPTGSNPAVLPDASLGSFYSVEFDVDYFEWPPVWSVEGLPAKESSDSELGWYFVHDKLWIDGIPTYIQNATYPMDLTLTVSVEDEFFASCDPMRLHAPGERMIQQTFKLTINPKVPLWSFESDQSGEPVAVVADPDGNTYTTGYTVNPDTSEDFFTALYSYNPNPNGAPFVTEKIIPFNGPGVDIPSDIAFLDGVVYVTGTSEGANSGPDIYTMAYDFNRPPGEELVWSTRYDGPSHLGDGANDILVDGEFVYVAGFVHRGNKRAHADYVVIKMNRGNGGIVWAETYDSRRNGEDFATAVAVDSVDNVYITGKSQESSTKAITTFDFFTVKYNSEGSLQWSARENGPLGPNAGDEEPTAIFVDDSGSVYVTGKAEGGPSGIDYFTAKYDSAGDSVWRNVYNGTGNGSDIPTGLAVFEGDVFVTGRSTGTNGFDYATIKYNSSGTLIDLSGDPAIPDFALRYDSGIGNDEAVGVHVDSNGIYVAGSIKLGTSENEADFLVVMYTHEGVTSWIAFHDGMFGKDDVATGLAVTDNGIFLSGYSWTELSRKVVSILAFEK